MENRCLQWSRDRCPFQRPKMTRRQRLALPGGNAVSVRGDPKISSSPRVWDRTTWADEYPRSTIRRIRTREGPPSGGSSFGSAAPLPPGQSKREPSPRPRGYGWYGGSLLRALRLAGDVSTLRSNRG